MKGSRRNYAPAFKAKVALEAAREESTVTELSRKYGVHANQVRGWSPEQIAQRLRVDFPHDPSMRISREAIYQALYVPGRGGLKWGLVVHLRTGRALRKPRARARRQAWASSQPGSCRRSNVACRHRRSRDVIRSALSVRARARRPSGAYGPATPSVAIASEASVAGARRDTPSPPVSRGCRYGDRVAAPRAATRRDRVAASNHAA